jgi:hypothetical protein
MNRFLRFALGVLICVQPATVHAQAIPGQSTAGTGNPIPGQTIRGTGNPIPGQTIPSIPGIGNPVPPVQSLAPTPSICGPGGEGVRVCNSDFQSCNSACAATVFNPTADVSACTDRCCNNLTVCLNIRRCSTATVNCFSLPGALGATQQGLLPP